MYRSQLAVHGAEMSTRRVLGLTAEHALLLRNALPQRVMRPRVVGMGCSLGTRTSPRRHLQTTLPHPRSWSITPPRPPSAHPRVPPSSTTDDTSTTTALSHQVRTLMRLLSHSVVVCTSTSPAKSAHHAPTPRAMTMSSFTSLALTPTPVVSFNIATPSRTYDAVAASRRFNIHVLADDVAGARVADYLTRGNAGGAKMFAGLAEECQCEMDHDSHQTPVLKGPGVLYVLRCRLLDEPLQGLVRVRDHVIVLGEVEEIVEGVRQVGDGDGAHKRKHEPEQFGLLYADRRYRQLGNCITPEKGHG